MHPTVSRRITKHVSRRGGYVEIGLYQKSLQLILACCFPVVHFHGSELRPQSGHVEAHDLRDHFMEQRIVDAIITPQGLPRRRHLAIISSISIAIFFIISATAVFLISATAVFLITAIITIITIVIIIITIIIVITMPSLGCGGEVACAPGGEWQVWILRIPQPPPCTLPDCFGPLGAAGRRQGLSSACYCFEASYWKGTVCYEHQQLAGCRVRGSPSAGACSCPASRQDSLGTPGESPMRVLFLRPQGFPMMQAALVSIEGGQMLCSFGRVMTHTSRHAHRAGLEADTAIDTGSPQ